MASRIEVFQDIAGKWRWHVRASNGNILSEGQAHRRKWNARRAALKQHPGLQVLVLPTNDEQNHVSDD